MKTLVIGASGATGRLVVQQLIAKGEQVRAVVRSKASLPQNLHTLAQLEIVEASILELTDEALQSLVSGCQSIVCCLGHTMNFKGIYGQPRRLVTNAVERLYNAVASQNNTVPVKFVLMNTSGNHNPVTDSPLMKKETWVLALLRALVPPHVDNEQAADFLMTKVGVNNPDLTWVIVRPDALTNDLNLSDYVERESPNRSAIFEAGKISRMNVGHFMARLVNEDITWQKWQGKMPVLYNLGSSQ